MGETALLLIGSAAIAGGSQVLAASLAPDLDTPTLAPKGEEDESAARASERARSRAKRRKGRGATNLTQGLLSKANVSRQTLGG